MQKEHCFFDTLSRIKVAVGTNRYETMHAHCQKTEEKDIIPK